MSFVIGGPSNSYLSDWLVVLPTTSFVIGDSPSNLFVTGTLPPASFLFGSPSNS